MAELKKIENPYISTLCDLIYSEETTNEFKYKDCALEDISKFDIKNSANRSFEDPYTHIHNNILGNENIFEYMKITDDDIPQEKHKFYISKKKLRKKINFSQNSFPKKIEKYLKKNSLSI